MPDLNLRRWIYIGVVLMLLTPLLRAQMTDLRFKKGAAKFEIPFSYENNFIIVEVLFNGVFPLKFIFDTGAEHTILTKREITDIMQVDYTRRFTLFGADLTTELYAFLATGVTMQVNELTAINRTILVLDADYFKFEEITGISIHGILGADFFRRFVVRIDYLRKKIVLYDPLKYNGPSRKYSEIPVEITRNKPYVKSDAYLNVDTTAVVKLLVDTGASLAVMLYTSSHPNLEVPEKVIKTRLGMGLGGYIEGFLGRLERFKLGEFDFGGVVTNFQDVLPSMDSLHLNDRNGILGNQILERFDLIIDYIRGKIYVAPNRLYKQKFRFDRSGMSVIAGGDNLSIYKILRVVEGSPADLAGIKRGDQLLSLNRIPVLFMDLTQISRKLKKRAGKRVRLKLARDGNKFKTRFRLRDLI